MLTVAGCGKYLEFVHPIVTAYYAQLGLSKGGYSSEEHRAASVLPWPVSRNYLAPHTQVKGLIKFSVARLRDFSPPVQGLVGEHDSFEVVFREVCDVPDLVPEGSLPRLYAGWVFPRRIPNPDTGGCRWRFFIVYDISRIRSFCSDTFGQTKLLSVVVLHEALHILLLHAGYITPERSPTENPNYASDEEERAAHLAALFVWALLVGDLSVWTRRDPHYDCDLGWCLY